MAMENLLWWIGSTLVYFITYGTLKYGRDWGTWQWSVKSIGVIALLTLPININGHVLTVFGNAVGEKGVYSIASFYQKANGMTLTIFAPLTYQDAGSGTGKALDGAVSMFGIPSIQKGRIVLLMGGIAPYQYAHETDSDVLVGFAGRQIAPRKTQVYVGLAFQQKVGEKERWFSAFTGLKADPKDSATSLPFMPKDLETAWMKLEGKSCRWSDGVVLSVTSYKKKEGPAHEIVTITKNGDLVALADSISLPEATRNTLYVKQVDGSWPAYDGESEKGRNDGIAALEATLEKTMAMTEEVFRSCEEKEK